MELTGRSVDKPRAHKIVHRPLIFAWCSLRHKVCVREGERDYKRGIYISQWNRVLSMYYLNIKLSTRSTLVCRVDAGVPRNGPLPLNPPAKLFTNLLIANDVFLKCC